jgi:hypothetical protein
MEVGSSAVIGWRSTPRIVCTLSSLRFPNGLLHPDALLSVAAAKKHFCEIVELNWHYFASYLKPLAKGPVLLLRTAQRLLRTICSEFYPGGTYSNQRGGAVFGSQARRALPCF